MKIELRNIKVCEFASEETTCFEATIYVDGQKRGDAHNDGKGGCTFINPPSLVDEMNAYAKTLPEKAYSFDMGEGHPKTYKQDAEGIVDDLVTEFLIKKDLKRDMRNNVLIIRGGKLLALKCKNPSPAMLDAIRVKHKAEHILNGLPIEEALALCLKHNV